MSKSHHQTHRIGSHYKSHSDKGSLVDLCKIISSKEKNLVVISEVEMKVHSSCHENKWRRTEGEKEMVRNKWRGQEADRMKTEGEKGEELVWYGRQLHK